MVCALTILYQRDLLYVPYNGPTEPLKAGLYVYDQTSFVTADGVSIPYWEYVPTNAKMTLLYFHGNRGGLHAFVPYLERFKEHNVRVVAMEYRGYPGAPPNPTERKIVADAVALYDHIKATSNQPVVIWGYSLGSGVAAQLAAHRPATAVVLEAPFLSAVARGQEMFPLLPVTWLMLDQYRSDEAITKTSAPILILHGGNDLIVPDSHGRALAALAPRNTTLKFYPKADHFTLAENGAYDDAFAWFLPKSTTP
jgi:pimeloyl-ACP methyl ester carboxylesterase